MKVQKLAKGLVSGRKWICLVFVLAVVAAAICIPLTPLNYDDTVYLPENSNTKEGLTVMEEEFGGGGSASVMLKDGGVEQTLQTIEQIRQIDGVSDVLWLDSAMSGMSSESLSLLLSALGQLPSDAEATPAQMLRNFSSVMEPEEISQALQLLGQMAGSDASALSALMQPLTEAQQQALSQLPAQLESLQSQGDLLTGLIDALAQINQNGQTLDAATALQLLGRAVAVLPTQSGTTGYAAYTALSGAFSQQELPVVLQLLGALGVDMSSLTSGDTEALMQPLADETLQQIAAAQTQMAGLQQSGQSTMLTGLLDAAVQNGMSGAETLELLSRLGTACSGGSSDTLSLLTALCKEFDDAELANVLSLGQAMGLLDEQAAALTQPVGESYAASISAAQSQVGQYYQDGSALFTVLFTEGDYAESTGDAIEAISNLSEDLYITGNAATAYYTQQSQTDEIVRASVMVVIVALALLVLLSTSWFDPLLYLVAIVMAIVLNLGTNFIFDSVSYLTQSIVCVLQLALSMDYAVFLVNRYKKERQTGLDAAQAMQVAWRRSLSPVSASSLTTIACFITIMFMQYKLGLDMGAVMAKGIVLSLLTVFLLLPGLVVLCDKWIMRAEHRSLHPTCQRLSGFCVRGRWIIAILAVAIVVPCAWLTGQNTFVYGTQARQSSESDGVQSLEAIEEVFGSQEQLALLLPADNEAELELVQNLQQLDGVLQVTSWAQLEASGQAAQLPENQKAQLVGSGSYHRVILLLDCPEEGEQTKALLSEIRQEISEAYPDGQTYLLGNTAAAEDLENSTRDDFNRISWYSILAVALIVALSFRSVLIPVILVAVIEGAVWINMAIPALTQTPVVFLGYMIISNVLLGSTIDYAILFTSNYREARQSQPVRESVRQAQERSLRPILTSGLIFTAGGLILGLMSTIPTVELLGFAIMRGGLCAIGMTMLVLPALLAILDKPIAKLSVKQRS